MHKWADQVKKGASDEATQPEMVNVQSGDSSTAAANQGGGVHVNVTIDNRAEAAPKRPESSPTQAGTSPEEAKETDPDKEKNQVTQGNSGGKPDGPSSEEQAAGDQAPTVQSKQELAEDKLVGTGGDKDGGGEPVVKGQSPPEEEKAKVEVLAEAKKEGIKAGEKVKDDDEQVSAQPAAAKPEIELEEKKARAAGDDSELGKIGEQLEVVAEGLKALREQGKADVKVKADEAETAEKAEKVEKAEKAEKAEKEEKAKAKLNEEEEKAKAKAKLGRAEEEANPEVKADEELAKAKIADKLEAKAKARAKADEEDEKAEVKGLKIGEKGEQGEKGEKGEKGGAAQPLAAPTGPAAPLAAASIPPTWAGPQAFPPTAQAAAQQTPAAAAGPTSTIINNVIPGMAMPPPPPAAPEWSARYERSPVTPIKRHRRLTLVSAAESVKAKDGTSEESVQGFADHGQCFDVPVAPF